MSSACLSINPSLSPPFIPTAATSSSSSSSFSSTVCVRPLLSSQSSGAIPSCVLTSGGRFCHSGRVRRKGVVQSKKLGVKASKMTISEIRPEEEEEGPPLLDAENNHSRPRRIALFVEPSPFA